MTPPTFAVFALTSSVHWVRDHYLAARRILERRRRQRDVAAREAQAEMARREAARALHEAVIAAQAAQRSRDEFLARMSHELRTPLNAVIGFARVLEGNRAGNQRPEDRELLARIRVNGEQLLGIVDSVLSHTELESGQFALELEDADVAAIAQRVVDHRASSARAKGIRIVAEIPKDAPAIPLDAGRFEQVVDNLVENAVKFTQRGEVRISLVTHAATKRPARLVVEDTGIGIPADRLESVFEPVEQVEAGRSRSYGGAGLGLPLARRLCAAMRCELRVQSTLGAGSRFSIVFP